MSLANGDMSASSNLCDDHSLLLNLLAVGHVCMYVCMHVHTYGRTVRGHGEVLAKGERLSPALIVLSLLP